MTYLVHSVLENSKLLKYNNNIMFHMKQ